MRYLNRHYHQWCHRVGLGLLGFGLALVLTVLPLQMAHGSSGDRAPSFPITPTIESASVLLSEGRSLYETGQFRAAVQTWQSAAQAFEQSGHIPQQIISLNHVSSAYQALSQWSEAERAIAQSLDLLTTNPEVASPILWAQTLNTHANLLLNLGQGEAAVETWTQSTTYYEAAGDVAGSVGSQINQAQALKSLGFYRRARQSLQTLNEQLGTMPDSNIKLSALRSLGQALHLMGYPQDSYTVLAYALDLARSLEAQPEISSILLSIGNLAAEVESADIALSYFDLAAQTATIPIDQLQAQLAIFATYVENGRTQPASALMPQIHQQIKSLPPSRATIYGTVNFVNNVLRLQEQPSAVWLQELHLLLAHAIEFAQEHQDGRSHAHALRQMGQLYAVNQQLSDALELTAKSLDIARSIQAKDVIYQAAWQLGQLEKQQGRKENAIAAYTEAVEALQALRSDLAAVNPEYQFSYREQVEPVYRDLVSLLITNHKSASLTQAREVLEALQVAELDNFFREACLDIQADQIAIDQVDPNATVLYSVILPDRLAIIYSQRDRPLQVYETPVDATTVEQTLRDFLASIHPSSDRRESLKIAETIYDWLVRPLETRGAIAPDQTLVFISDGLLRNIPLAALYDGEQYLIEKYAVALSPGLQLMQSRTFGDQGIKALVGGISQARGAFHALPAVIKEVKTISQLVGTSAILDQALTRESLTQTLQGAPINVVHLATHGQFSSNFSETYVLAWDGLVNINELSEILRNREGMTNQAIELLTLSACETAAGDERSALGLAGLAVRSGARSTVATLWPIRDNAAAQLMIEFYTQLKLAQTSKAEALRQAQLSLLHGGDFNDPFFWSAYVMIGNWL
ncbi:MAG: CHAT domain-containing protein [Cyanothece sp. SIO2G6]|nr:CHAT domain-containing protein [Cyanothece sp. SIO2G6]